MFRISGSSAAIDELSQPHNVKYFALACLVVLLGSALRFYDLGAESFWFDELITMRIASEGPGEVLVSFVHGAHPPVQLLLTTLWIRAAGTTEFSTRYLSAFAGTVSIAAIYVAGRRLFCRRVGVISAVLVALSEFQIHYSQEARYYSLFLAFTILSFLFYLRAIERRDGLSRGLHALVTITMCYTHTYGVFVIVAQNLHFLLSFWPLRQGLGIRRLGAWVASQLLVLLALLPVLRLGETVRGTMQPLSGLGEPSLSLLRFTLLRYVGSRFPARATVVVAMLFLGCASLAFILYVGKRRWVTSLTALANSAETLFVRKSELVLVALWLLCPMLIPWALSKVVRPMYVVRYTISAAPALYLLLAYVASAIRRVVPEPAVLGFVVILIAPGLHDYYVGVTKEDWRGAARYVTDHVRSEDAVVVPHTVLGRFAFDWYYAGPIQNCEMDPSRRDSAAVIAAAKRCAGESSRLWLVFWAYNFHGRHIEEADGRAAGLRLAEQRQFHGVRVYVFDKAEDGDDSGSRQKKDVPHYAASSAPWGQPRSAGKYRPREASPTLGMQGAPGEAHRRATDR